MHSLLSFIFKYRASLLFVLLEVLSVYFIVNSNDYHQAAFINSSNQMVASVMRTSNSVGEYFTLAEVNQKLSEENAKLHELLQNGLQPADSLLNKDSLALETLAEDSVSIIAPRQSRRDSLRLKQYVFLPAKVVENTVKRAKNYVTIDKGRAEGVEKDMGVICPDGIVGKVKDVSEHFAVVTSLLHTEMFISVLIKRSNTLGSVQWSGRNSTVVNLHDIPIHINVITGDTIITSGYSGIYPPGTLVGTVAEVRPEEDAAFYDIDVDLSTEFQELSHVYVVKNQLKQEKDSLEAVNFRPNE